MRQSSQAAAFVGRDNELEIVHRRLAALGDGQGAIVLVSGEPGIGKTALTLACAERGRAMGTTVALGRCYDGGGQPPFAPWGDVFSSLSSGTATDSTVLPPPFGTGPAPQSAHQLIQVLTSLLHERARERPLMVILEDVHWADGDALDLLDVVTRDLTRAAILVMVTYRPEAVHRSHPFYDVLARLRRDRPAEFLHLDVLSVEETSRLVAEMAGSCSPELITYLHARADGHPLFVVELLRDLQERHLLPRDETGRLQAPIANAPVPEVLGHLIGHRVGRLGVDVETLLVVAAVAGEEWDLGIVETVLGWEEEPLLRGLDGALRGEVIVPVADHPERYRFRHALIRDALYHGQLARRRRHLHHRLGTILEETAGRESDLTALAYHFGEAEVWEKAVAYGIAAGDAARDRYATHGTVVAYRQALDALVHVSPEIERELHAALLERLGRAVLVLGERAAAEETFQRMREVARASGDRGSESRALSWISFVQRRLYNLTGAREAAVAAVAAAEEIGEPRVLALAHWGLGQIHEVTGELDESVEHAREAERFARDEGDREVLSRSLLIRAHVAIWRGRFIEGHRCTEEALALAHAGRDALAVTGSLWRMGLALGEVGRYDAARRQLLAGIELAEATGEGNYLAKMLNTIGWLHLELGDPEGAAVWDGRALENVRGSHHNIASEAERHTLLNLVANHLAGGDADGAAARLDEYDALQGEINYVRFRYLGRYHLLRAEVALVQGDHATTLRFAREAEAVATNHDMPKHLAKSRFLTGRALLAQGRPGDAVEAVTEGIELADRMGHGSLRWQGRLWLGRALEERRQDGSGMYREAWDRISAIASELGDADQRARFLASPLVELVCRGVESAGKLTRADRPAGLTDRELDVLRLVARHRTDKEIAAALFISFRTVQTHVGNICAKLDAGNRREAADAAERLGIL
jgi:DNA-binding CsgD family transcriptional regulator/tetratricopeptide (TPR) repeat protein